jgi:hypothetical protein
MGKVPNPHFASVARNVTLVNQARLPRTRPRPGGCKLRTRGVSYGAKARFRL